jgi:L-alanine-DL-glutamate epimerase-like enolase superfamily enzyme
MKSTAIHSAVKGIIALFLFVPFLLGCYLIFFEGVRRLQFLENGFSFGLIVAALIYIIGGYGVVKLKVAGSEGSARVKDLREWLGSGIALRLDANGAMNFADASALLAACKDCKIESFEEPLDSTSPQLADELLQLHEISGVPLVADESVCTLADLESWATSGGYQVINVRIGKCGGINGAAAMLKAAKAAGFDVVAGTMVGETPVLLRASAKMLEYWNDLDYVEGIDQSRQLLGAEPIVTTKGQDNKHFKWIAKGFDEFCISRQFVN